MGSNCMLVVGRGQGYGMEKRRGGGGGQTKWVGYRLRLGLEGIDKIG
jgi:hypothetical protein